MLSHRLTDGFMTIHKAVWQGNIFQVWNSWEVWPPHSAATLQQNAGRGLPSHPAAKGQRAAVTAGYSQLPSLWSVRWGHLKWLATSEKWTSSAMKVADDLWCLPAHFSELFYAICTNWTRMFYKLHFEDSALHVMLYAVLNIFSKLSVYRFNFVSTLKRCSCSNLFSSSFEGRLTMVSFICF